MITFKTTEELEKEFNAKHPLVQSPEIDIYGQKVGKWGFISHQFYFKNRQQAALARSRVRVNYVQNASRIIISK